MNLARKATFLAAKAGYVLTLASLMGLGGTDRITAEPVIAEAAMAKQSRTERVSVDSAGTQANGWSGEARLSANGRFVVFTSLADLVSGLQRHPAGCPPYGQGSEIFLHDRTTGATELLSINSAGQQGNQNSMLPAISADGRFVAFSSYADNLVPGDTNVTPDVFVRDRATGVTERVSVDSAGTQAQFSDTGCWWDRVISISANGRFVAFSSLADNLVPGDTNHLYDIFVHDRATGVTERVNVGSNGTQANGDSGDVALSADGRFVAFTSSANNLVPGDTNNLPDVFVHDRTTGVTERISVDSAGRQANNGSGIPALSADGHLVVFSSEADNLVPGDTNGVINGSYLGSDIFVHDRATGVTERVSVDSAGTQANGPSFQPTLSANGRFVAFISSANNLVPGDTNNLYDIFVHDRMTGMTERVSVDSDGTQANGESGGPVLSANGRSIVFSSGASNLVAGDTNATSDVFVHDRMTQQNGVMLH